MRMRRLRSVVYVFEPGQVCGWSVVKRRPAIAPRASDELPRLYSHRGDCGGPRPAMDICRLRHSPGQVARVRRPKASVREYVYMYVHVYVYARAHAGGSRLADPLTCLPLSSARAVSHHFA